MDPPSRIRVLGATSNQRGDLFTRLVRDLFFSLGYDNLELDVATSGREIDIQGEHRFEPRRLVAECKAQLDQAGGGDLNKFLGVLTRERKRHNPQPVAGYFVSLGGFTGTSIQQEKESGDDAVILFNAERVVTELQRGRVVVPLADATERAGRCALALCPESAQLGKAELICHATGYLWAFYFTQNKETTHFILIHADGTPLAELVARAVVNADREDGGELHTLAYLAPPAVLDARVLREGTLAQYRAWLGEECGYIQLDGLPADSDLSATKLRLEKLFVPLRASYMRERPSSAPERETFAEPIQTELAQHDLPVIEPLAEEIEPGTELHFDPLEELVDSETLTEPIGLLLGRKSHLAILASPGGGKSTLVKRLATAYSFPNRRLEVSDGLPDRDWLPLYLRCRDLRDRSNRPVLELLHGIASFANMSEEHARCFRSIVSDALRSGRTLLLVDGLDEISEEGARRAFAQNLRTFVAMFPQSALVITSRVAGYRDVAGVIAGTCLQATLAPLNETDVNRLCVSWHVEVIADTEKVRREATELAKFIWSSRHIRALVENPLLLTTLLVVKRSNGEIPPTRAELYSEAVRVLVRTWNVEGYAPLDERETLARLSFVACAMMQRGIQLIGTSALVDLLRAAAAQMEPELQFAKVSPTEFIQRIEFRSSLLMQTGYQRIDGQLQPVFEFRHLTFQEYLAARGFVSEQYPGRNDEASLVDVLTPHINDERWQEVIPLVTVLAGRKADPIIKQLTTFSSVSRSETGDEIPKASSRAVSILGQCLVEEVTITPSTLRTALLEVGCKSSRPGSKPLLDAILKGKFGDTFREVVQEAYFSGTGDWFYYDSALSEASRIDLVKNGSALTDELLAKDTAETVVNGDREGRVRAALVAMQIAFACRDDAERVSRILRPHSASYRLGLSKMLESGDLPSVQAAAWTLAWFGPTRVWLEPTPIEMVLKLYEYWRHGSAPELVRKAAWAFCTQPLFPRGSIPKGTWGQCDEWLRSQMDKGQRSERAGAAITLGWYLHSPWTDAELTRMIVRHFPHHGFRSINARLMLTELGDDGAKVLDKWEKRK